MAIPQLYYFTIRGFGEYIRLFFLDNGIKFEDIRIDSNSKEWKDGKKNTIFGQLPYLKIDGKEFVQAGAIMRHLAKIYSLNGSNEDESFFLDMFNECVRDLRVRFSLYIYKDAETREQLASKTLPEFLGRLEKLFKTHPGDFIIGDKISYADYFLFEELDVYRTFEKTILDGFPTLKEFWERMWNRPNLKAYLEKRKAEKVWTHLVQKGSNYN